MTERRNPRLEVGGSMAARGWALFESTWWTLLVVEEETKKKQFLLMFQLISCGDRCQARLLHVIKANKDFAIIFPSCTFHISLYLSIEFRDFGRGRMSAFCSCQSIFKACRPSFIARQTMRTRRTPIQQQQRLLGSTIVQRPHFTQIRSTRSRNDKAPGLHRRNISTTVGLQHGHIEKPKPGEE